MSKDALPAIANVSTATCVGSSYMAYIAENAATISIFIAVLTLLVSIAAHWVNANIKNKVATASQKKLELEAERITLEIKKIEYENRKIELEYKLSKNRGNKDVDNN